MLNRFVCVHGHFYQPPRENPWIDTIDLQPSAAPYHDWNARVAAECYAPNTAARILDAQKRIRHIINNYAWMSFNVGPTLMRWLAQHDHETYRNIIAADHEGRQRYGGHGPAIAQVYGHLIMPLATPRDRRTQVAWGVADFVHHYGRQPEGMWLAETAVCTDSLEALAEHGITFTILAPHQAYAVRPLTGGDWQFPPEHGIDTTQPYQVNLPSGRSIAVFFYNGGVSQAIAFQGLLNNGESLANALLGALPQTNDRPCLAHVATDGESYGHHHRHGEMALAYALHHIQQSGQARITVYGEFLALCPPTHEVTIVEQSSWSCAHGVERWRSDCGCHTGGEPGWNQAWRGPLREALDWARLHIEPAWERRASAFFDDPWHARDAYIDVINSPNDRTIADFLQKHGKPGIDRFPALGLLELQRQLMQSYTSCAWFFNDASGIETIQVMRYAARALQLAHQTMDLDVSEGFHEHLEKVVSNTGVTLAELYQTQVQPLQIHLADVCAHDALTALFLDTPPIDTIYQHHIERQQTHRWNLGELRITLGVSQITASLTGEQQKFLYGVILADTQVLTGGISPYPQHYDMVLQHIEAAVQAQQQDRVIAVMHAEIGTFDYTLRSIFKDEQRIIMTTMLQGVVDDTVRRYHDLYREHVPLMKFLQSMALPLPSELQVAAHVTMHADISQALATTPPDINALTQTLNAAIAAGVTLDVNSMRHQFQHTLLQFANQLSATGVDVDQLERITAFIDIISPYDVDLWVMQNHYNVVWQRTYPAIYAKAGEGDPSAQLWCDAFVVLGTHLNMAVVDGSPSV
jgi:alpha-amylase/alpha-mannosidase (GH57 family)